MSNRALFVPSRVAVVLGAATLALSVAACGSSAGGARGGGSRGAVSSSGAVHVGVLEIATAAVVDQTVAAFEKQLVAKLAPRKVTFTVKNAEGDQSLMTSISRDFAQSSDDAFAVIGTPAVVSLAQQIKNKPIFALAIGDPVGAKVAQSLDAPGHNVTGSIDYVDPAVLLAKIMTITPTPKKIGTIYDPSNQNMQVWVRALHHALSKYPGVSVVESTISGAGDVSTAARSLAGRVDIELIGPDATVLSALPAVGSTARSNRIPVYLCGGDATVTGILASIGPDYPTLGRLAADGAARVLSGTPAAVVPFGRPVGVVFTVNKKTMTSVKVMIPASILKSATVQ